MPEVSVVRRGVLINHNYRNLLNDAGYELIHHENVPSLTLISDVDGYLGAFAFFIAMRNACRAIDATVWTCSH